MGGFVQYILNCRLSFNRKYTKYHINLYYINSLQVSNYVKFIKEGNNQWKVYIKIKFVYEEFELKEILNKYKNSIINLNGRNRSLSTKKLYKKSI